MQAIVTVTENVKSSADIVFLLPESSKLLVHHKDACLCAAIKFCHTLHYCQSDKQTFGGRAGVGWGADYELPETILDKLPTYPVGQDEHEKVAGELC